jgi:hypothetical protein
VQAAYNWALACCHHHGRDHPDTRAALVATEKADPQAWVPNLLAGLAYPVLSLASRHVRGHKMEAAVSHQRGQLQGRSTGCGRHSDTFIVKLCCAYGQYDQGNCRATRGMTHH